MSHKSLIRASIIFGTLIAVNLLVLLVEAEAKPVVSVQKDADGVTFKMDGAVLKLQVFSDRIVRVVYAPGEAFPETKSFSVIAKPEATQWTYQENGDDLVLTTSVLEAHVERKTGAISFADAAGKPFLAEAAGGGKSFAPTTIAKEDAQKSRQEFALAPDESIFGLGQQQDGFWNYRGKTVQLLQVNTRIGLPVIISSRGYGMLWDNPAITNVDVGIPGKENILAWNSEAAKDIDYYFMAGPDLNDVVASYRQLTGSAPMFGKWAYGFWQCKEHYATQQELLDVVAQYRKRGTPIDGIIQDWQYWVPAAWGSHAFDPPRYPDPAGMMEKLHKDNVHLIISVWPWFDVGCDHYKQLDAINGLLDRTLPETWPTPADRKYYDAFNAKAREIYWKQISDSLFKYGIDGWWLDASEPELDSPGAGALSELNTAAGPGAYVANAYPLMTTTAVYQGQRAESSAKRVFILTRSAYAGQQRNAAVSWSGDISGEWATYKRQIPAGLNFSLSGIPYWNTDIGGFTGGAPSDSSYSELFTRWFQFGSFCPMFRVHGTGEPKEMWRFSPDIDAILVKFDQIRYRLMPYIYSVAWQVTHANDTMMRPLVLDFRTDAEAIKVGDQFMFGRAMMVCPVTEPIGGDLMILPNINLADKDGKVGGLSATYFQGVDFKEKKLERRDETISFDWDKQKRAGVGADIHRDPIPGLTSMDNFSARWEGFLVTKEAGDYKLSLRADDGMRMWVDGKLVIDDWRNRPVLTNTVTLPLEANRKVPIKIEYYQAYGFAIVELRWQPPQKAESKIFARDVYLPAGQDWYDFWTGKRVAGGQTITTPAPIDTMPIYVKAGSILPMGPVVNYAMEKPAAPIELRVYRGKDGAFTLYEDVGDNYNYEKGEYTEIPITWNDKTDMLTIGARKGSFPGMPQTRQFHVVWVSESKGAGIAEEKSPDATISYSGATTEMKMP